ncbi:MAG: sulfatase-like hydrolase/transferase, partial [Planctomycetes bacterium]|nr:sulfatase-like hydrolase/transferase [Planctomycetota bacterium]
MSVDEAVHQQQPPERLTAKRWPRVVLILLPCVVVASVMAVRGTDRAALTQKRTKGLNVVLVSLDTVRQDHLSCYGYERNTTPRIDALAKDGLRLTRCAAVSNWTLPSHASMLCGLYPTTHGAHWATTDVPHVNAKNPAGLMKAECVTLAEVLREAGYRTGAVLANPQYLQKAYQLDQGFDHYDA